MTDRNLFDFKNITITAAGTISNEVIAQGKHELLALHLPANWDTQDITFTSCSTAGGTFNPVKALDDPTTNYTLATAAASSNLSLTPAALAGQPYLKIISGAAQTNTVTIVAILRHVEQMGALLFLYHKEFDPGPVDPDAGLLLEDGVSFLLLEDGDFLVLE